MTIGIKMINCIRRIEVHTEGVEFPFVVSLYKYGKYDYEITTVYKSEILCKREAETRFTAWIKFLIEALSAILA